LIIYFLSKFTFRLIKLIFKFTEYVRESELLEDLGLDKAVTFK
jgi:hypothetical protein